MRDTVDGSDRPPRRVQRVHAQHPRLGQPLRSLAMEVVVPRVSEAVGASFHRPSGAVELQELLGCLQRVLRGARAAHGERTR